MSVLFILISVSIVVAGSALAAFLWSIRSGQYDDEYTPSVRILFDDMPEQAEPATENNSTQNK